MLGNLQAYFGIEHYRNRQYVPLTGKLYKLRVQMADETGIWCIASSLLVITYLEISLDRYYSCCHWYLQICTFYRRQGLCETVAPFFRTAIAPRA